MPCTTTESQVAVAEKRLIETTLQMDGRMWIQDIQRIIKSAGTQGMPWSLADRVFNGFRVAPETRYAYRLWRAAKIAQQTSK